MEGSWLLGFADQQLEREYVLRINKSQALLDLVCSVNGVVTCILIAQRALVLASCDLLLKTIFAMVTMGLPVIVMFGNREQYVKYRHLWILVWLPSSWWCMCQATTGYMENPLPTGRQLGPQLAALAQLGSLAAQLLLRTTVVPLICCNVGVRQVLRRHMLAHAMALAVTASFNHGRCQWLLRELPFVGMEALRFTEAARQLGGVHLPGFQATLAGWLGSGSCNSGGGGDSSGGGDDGSSSLGDAALAEAAGLQGATALPGDVAAGDGSREQLQACLTCLLFFQLFVCYVLPSYVLWLTELASRRRFLAEMRAAGREQRRCEAEHVPGIPQQQWLWQLPLAAVACWHLAEVTALLAY